MERSGAVPPFGELAAISCHCHRSFAAFQLFTIRNVQYAQKTHSHSDAVDIGKGLIY